MREVHPLGIGKTCREGFPNGNINHVHIDTSFSFTVTAGCGGETDASEYPRKLSPHADYTQQMYTQDIPNKCNKHCKQTTALVTNKWTQWFDEKADEFTVRFNDDQGGNRNANNWYLRAEFGDYNADGTCCSKYYHGLVHLSGYNDYNSNLGDTHINSKVKWKVSELCESSGWNSPFPSVSGCDETETGVVQTLPTNDALEMRAFLEYRSGTAIGENAYSLFGSAVVMWSATALRVNPPPPVPCSTDTYAPIGTGYCDPPARMGKDGRTDAADWGNIPNFAIVSSDEECQAACSALESCNFAAYQANPGHNCWMTETCDRLYYDSRMTTHKKEREGVARIPGPGDCEQATVAAGHAFFWYNEETGGCDHSATCYPVVDPEWAAYAINPPAVPPSAKEVEIANDGAESRTMGHLNAEHQKQRESLAAIAADFGFYNTNAGPLGKVKPAS